MPPSELLIAFIAATAVFAFIPGPGMLYMAVQTMAHGTRAGWLSSFAFHIASYLHILAAAFGVTLILMAAPVLLLILKVFGGCYLIWMGISLWKQKDAAASSVGASSATRSRKAFRDSLIIEILNPKSALFYFAFLPQFTTLEAAFPIWMQLVMLGVIANLAFSLSDIVCIVFARLLATRAAASVPFAAFGRRLGGAILVTMGARLVYETR